MIKQWMRNLKTTKQKPKKAFIFFLNWNNLEQNDSLEIVWLKWTEKILFLKRVQINRGAVKWNG